MTCCTFCVDRSDRHRSAPQLSAVSVYSGACSVRCSSSRSENVISCLHSSCDYKKSQRMNKQNQTMSRVLCVAGGKGFPQEFYCEAPDCAARVKSVFCNDKQLLSGDRIQECAGPPPPDSVCQHQGRAFVSTVSGAECEFEGTDSYIKTKKCTGIYLYSQESFVFTNCTTTGFHCTLCLNIELFHLSRGLHRLSLFRETWVSILILSQGWDDM